jgi:two-component system sensor histidine kinase KdpD
VRSRGGSIRTTLTRFKRTFGWRKAFGATVVRVKAERPFDGLIAFAQREGVTHVIFGQSARTRWELLWRGSTLDRFLGAVPDAAVQVVPLTDH